MKEFQIAIGHLLNREHHFSYPLIGKEFFAHYGNAIIREGQFSAEVTLNKHDTFIETEFSIRGTTMLVCDRSLDEFEYPMDIFEKIIFKYGAEEQEIGDNLVIINPTRENLDVGQHIYEFIGLCLPAKRLHPRYMKDEAEGDELVYQSAPPAAQKDERWDALKKLNYKIK